jgi:integrase
VFASTIGTPIEPRNINRRWDELREGAGLDGLRLHDLRHTGNTMAAGQGASLRELMERMGHSSARAALIYQHATQERDEAIAAGMGKLLRQARRKNPGGRTGTEAPSGTQRARAPKRAS